MKKTSAILTLILVAFVLMTVGFACSSSDDSSTQTNKTTTTNTSANSAANSATNSTNSGSSSSNSTTSSSTPTDISGDYSATGTNEGGNGNYTANLVVTDRDDVYQFSWDSKGVKYDGVGVQTGNKVAVSYTTGTNGKGCGVILYKINSDGSLDGKAGYWGTNTQETETAKRTSGTDVDGEYDVEGKNTGGESYKSKLAVKKAGEGYTFEWTG